MWPDYPPQVITADATQITYTSAVSGGQVIYDGGREVTDRGIYWSSTADPANFFKNNVSNGSGAGSYVCTIENLEPGRRYYVWAYASNRVGMGFGNPISFVTNRLITFNPNLTYGTVSDIGNNNIYRTIQIGTQTWMAENLRTTLFRDWSVIPNIKDPTEWSTSALPAYCLYENNDSTYKETYGALYNFQVVNSGILCPAGWHVPSSAEWTTLENFLGGGDIAGGKLKETGPVNWQNPNTGATNESGFTALPSGVRGSDGAFSLFKETGTWWLADGYAVSVSYDGITIFNAGNNEKYGYSVRCMKD